MKPATKSAPHAKVKKSHGFLSIWRRIVVSALTGGVAAVTVGFAAFGAVMMGVGWLLTVSLEARAELQSVVMDAPRQGRLTRTGWFADGMPSLSAAAADVSPFPAETAPERHEPASIVALAFAAIGSSTIADHHVVRVVTNSVKYVSKAYVSRATAPDPVTTGSLGRLGVIDGAQPPPLPRTRLAALSPPDNLPKQPEVDRRTAVYDITARTVYLPNGERLEAHSGFGRFMDDPRHVSRKNRGATPPNTYKLTLRESLFNGVRAIRMTPVGDGEMYGRDGILAHSYLLGSSGQSHGCVSFKDYPKFLQAFLRGEIDRIEVVTRLAQPPVFARPDVT